MRCTQTIFLKADARRAQTKILQDVCYTRIQRLDIRMIDRDPLDPRVAQRDLLCKRVQHDDRLSLAWPQEHEAADGVGKVKMPCKRSGQGHAGQIGKVDAGADRNRFEAIRVHVLIEARNVGDDFPVRQHTISPDL